MYRHAALVLLVLVSFIVGLSWMRIRRTKG